MDSRQKALAALIVVGGTAVLGSYFLAFAYSPDVRGALWGGVPAGLQAYYIPNMFLAAAGFFPFTYLLLFGSDPDAFERHSGASFRTVIVLYVLILIPSALWLPLTAQLTLADSTPLWWLILIVLWAVALGSTGLLVLLFRAARSAGGALHWAAVIGCVPFWIQTAVLDALIWPAYFPR